MWWSGAQAPGFCLGWRAGSGSSLEGWLDEDPFQRAVSGSWGGQALRASARQVPRAGPVLQLTLSASLPSLCCLDSFFHFLLWSQRKQPQTTPESWGRARKTHHFAKDSEFREPSGAEHRWPAVQ